MKIYFCFTYYHTLIAMIKTMQDGQKADIILANDIPGYVDLKRQLEKTDCFRRFYEYDAVQFTKEHVFKNKIERALKSRKIVRKTIPQLVDLDLDNLTFYSDIYIFNDMTGIAKYLILKNIQYHLIEDGLDYYSYFDKYYDIKESSFAINGFRKKVKELFGMGFTCWGQSECCVDIEVNKIEGIKIPKDKVFEVPRRELFDSLQETQKKLIYATYAKGENLQMSSAKSMILFTQPLFADQFVQSMDEQEKVFETIVEEYVDNGYGVTIKPHPRDLMDYSKLIARYHCAYIAKNIPSEVLNFDKDVSFDVAVSVTSTAINFLKRVKEKRFMGRDYIGIVLSKKKS